MVSDYVPWRLHQYRKTLTYEQALFILEGALKGFSELLYKVKIPFLIENYMIGVDAYGEVKVWWNEAFCKNNFAKELSTNLRLKEMIMSLIDCLAIKLNKSDSLIFQNCLTIGKELNFLEMQKSLMAMSKGLNLKVIGKNMIKEDSEVVSVFEKIGGLGLSRISESQVIMNSEIKQSTFFS